MTGRGGLGLALFAAVLAALIFTQAAQQLARDIQLGAGDLKSSFHFAPVPMGGSEDHDA